MGSFVSQLATVADTWGNKIGTYGDFLRKMKEKVGKKVVNFHINGRIWKSTGQIVINLAGVFISWSYKNILLKLWKLDFLAGLPTHIFLRFSDIPRGATGQENTSNLLIKFNTVRKTVRKKWHGGKRQPFCRTWPEKKCMKNHKWRYWMEARRKRFGVMGLNSF